MSPCRGQVISAQQDSIGEMERKLYCDPWDKKARFYLGRPLQVTESLQDYLIFNRKNLQDWNALHFAVVLDFLICIFLHSPNFRSRMSYLVFREIDFICMYQYVYHNF